MNRNMVFIVTQNIGIFSYNTITNEYRLLIDDSAIIDASIIGISDVDQTYYICTISYASSVFSICAYSLEGTRIDIATYNRTSNTWIPASYDISYWWANIRTTHYDGVIDRCWFFVPLSFSTFVRFSVAIQNTALAITINSTSGDNASSVVVDVANEFGEGTTYVGNINNNSFRIRQNGVIRLVDITAAQSPTTKIYYITFTLHDAINISGTDPAQSIQWEQLHQHTQNAHNIWAILKVTINGVTNLYFGHYDGETYTLIISDDTKIPTEVSNYVVVRTAYDSTTIVTYATETGLYATALTAASGGGDPPYTASTTKICEFTDNPYEIRYIFISDGLLGLYDSNDEMTIIDEAENAIIHKGIKLNASVKRTVGPLVWTTTGASVLQFGDRVEVTSPLTGYTINELHNWILSLDHRIKALENK